MPWWVPSSDAKNNKHSGEAQLVTLQGMEQSGTHRPSDDPGLPVMDGIFPVHCDWDPVRSSFLLQVTDRPTHLGAEIVDVDLKWAPP